jgi:uncharacterized protein
MCERRIWLDQHGDRSLRTETPQNQRLAGKQHEQLVSATMFGPTAPVAAESWEEMVYSTHDLMIRGAGAIQGAAFERTIHLSQPLTVRGRIDWLRRNSQPSQLGKWSYEPVEIKLRQQLSEADQLQLDLYIWLLQEIQVSEPSGWFWMGRDVDNSPLQIIEHTYDEQRLFAALERAATLLNQSSAPSVFLASHCDICHWHSACKQVATSGRSLAALPGLPRQTWEHMRREGIHTLDHVLALTPQELVRFKGLGKSKAQEIYTYAQAVNQGQPIQRKPVPEAALQSGMMLDLETCIEGSVGVPWCFGWQGSNEQFQVAIVDAFCDFARLKLPDDVEVRIVSSSDEGWRMFAQAAENDPGPIYHWGSFEKGVLRATAPTEVVVALEDRLHDLNKTFKQTFAFPVKGTSIKTIAPYLGFHWPEGTNAFAAWDDYRAWLLESDKYALARACSYNRADVEAMALIWHWMSDNNAFPASGKSS